MTKDLMAAITVLSYGYDVSVLINGSDIGITGGTSESFRLFGKNHTMATQLPEDMKNLVCLKRGTNEITFTFTRTGREENEHLTLELKSKEQFVNEEFLVYFNDETEAGSENSVTKTFTL